MSKVEMSNQRTYRTKKMAGETDRVPELIMLPSTSNYRAALSFKEDGKDFVVPLRQELKIRYDKNTGEFYYDDVELDLLDLDKAREADLTTTDLWPLRVMYSIIGTSLIDQFNNGSLNPKNVIDHSVKVRVAELMGALCSKGNVSKDRAVDLINKLLNYSNVIGIIYEDDKIRNKEWRSFYPMLLWMAIEEKDNTIRFTSPYLNMLLYKVMEESIRVDKKGLPQHKKNGELLFEAHHSYLVKTSISKERNKRAAEIARIVCVLIEEAGDHGVAHITAQYILNRHAELKQAIDSTSDVSNQNKILRRSFVKAWELLHTQTRLEEVYDSIKLPGEYDYPTMATLEKSFDFPHKGKKKGNS